MIDGKLGIADIITTSNFGIKFVSGGSGLVEVLNLSNKKRYQIIRSISEIENELDYLIIDCPAGASDSTLFLLMLLIPCLSFW